jgi:hypothetical protein
MKVRERNEAKRTRFDRKRRENQLETHTSNE